MRFIFLHVLGVGVSGNARRTQALGYPLSSLGCCSLVWKRVLVSASTEQVEGPLVYVR